jgi:23S rRNA (adenine1618-N6)-methyltransferase
MHPKNRHQGRYNLENLSLKSPQLKSYLVDGPHGMTVDFSRPEGVKALNKAILESDYGMTDWDLPQDFLCPPVPGRADYIHHLADLPGPDQNAARVLDIGVGANAIYPIIGIHEYNWTFVGSDIEPRALAAAQKLIDSNSLLKGKLELRLQTDSSQIFKGIISQGEKFDLSLCNPPFHSSAEEALAGTNRKLKNLGRGANGSLNFGGQSQELWTTGGEKRFIRSMIFESVEFKDQVRWFSSLVSKGEYLQEFERIAEKQGARFLIVPMEQGQKRARLIAWTFN